MNCLRKNAQKATNDDCSWAGEPSCEKASGAWEDCPLRMSLQGWEAGREIRARREKH